MNTVTGVPARDEAVAYYFTYIDRITGADVDAALEQQMDEATIVLRAIPEEKSLYRYAPDKWTIRQLWGHVNDTERVFVYRALWFARGFDVHLPSFDQDLAVAGAQADAIAWARHVEEFRDIRKATLAFFRNLPEEAWNRRGTASGNSFTVRAIAYIVAGHAAHHLAILKERYL